MTLPSPAAARPLAQLLGATPEVPVRGSSDVDDRPITDITHDSREVRPGAIFVCVRGGTVDGHLFAAEAARAGAVALVVDHPLGGELGSTGVAQIVVDDTRQALAWLSAELHGRPSRALTMLGVTGTNGKTTTTHLIAAILTAAGRRTGIIGTLSGPRTTPEAPELQRRLAEFVATGVEAVAMEVSSHALALQRVLGTHFDVAVFTNLGVDHLDLHRTQERYFAAKAMLFEPALADRAAVNADDLHGRLLIDAATIPMTPFRLEDAVDLEIGPRHHAYTWRGARVHVPLGGRFNVTNSLAAATACELAGVDRDAIVAGLAAASAVPGRFEAVDAGQGFDVIVDYAHTPEGLREVLTAGREASRGGKVLVVFGCGGDRDRDKRPQMGAAAADLADVVVVTSDNPRSEDPRAIIDAVLAGVPSGYGGALVVEPDRRGAIAAALHAAHPGDVVVIAGKGNEATQTVGDAVVPFDDRVVARELLEAMRAGGRDG